MVVYIKDEMINSIAEDEAISAILGVVGTAILALATAGTFLFFSGLLDAVVAGIFSFGVAAWQAAFTTDVYTKFRCAIYNNMDTDDSIDDAGVNALLSYINSNFTGIVQATLYGYVHAMGRVGCTNAIRSNRGSDAADCSDCDCLDGCTVDWTFFGVHSDTIVKISDCHYTMTTQASLGHFAFTSGDSAIGCYFAGTGALSFSTWGLGSSTPNGVNSKTSQIWNYDAILDDGTELDLIFSSAPIP
jgi:hypothetical protein